MISCLSHLPASAYFGASTTIRLAVMVKVPLMLGMGLLVTESFNAH